MEPTKVSGVSSNVQTVMRRFSVARFARTGLVCLVCLLSVGRLNSQTPGPPPPPRAPAAAASPAAVVPPPVIPPDPSIPLPSFEVASVRKLVKPPTSSGSRSGPGRMVYTNVPLRTLMMQAWGLRDYQIIGGPSWITTDRFSINAKAEKNVPRDQVLLMLRSLIVERFNLKYRGEKRELPAYVITTLPGKEWKPTAHMKPCTVVSRPPSAALLAAAKAAGVTLPETTPTPPPPPGAPPPCDSSTLSSGTSGLTLTGTTSTLASLLGSLGGLGQVQDRTGLTGTYRFTLDPSVIEGRLSASLPSTGDSLLPNVSSGGSLGSSIQDLGLKLERRKEPVDVLVIESVSLPDED
jgi:uncharacterized protein (TIGR03435 family)